MIETIPSRLYWLVGLFLCFGISWFFYRKEFFIKTSPVAIKWSLIIVRATSLFVIFYLCLDPFISYQQKNNLKPEVLILVDNSQSMEFGGVTVDSIQNVLDQIRNNLTDDVRVACKSFGAEISPFDSLSLGASKTNFRNSFQEAASLYEGRNLVASIIVSDGIVNVGSKNQLAGIVNCPLYFLACGDTSLKKDIVLKHLYHNNKTVVGNEIPLQVEGVVSGFRGGQVDLVFYIGNQKVGSESVRVNKDDQSFVVNKAFSIDSLGLQKLTVRASGLEEEFTFSNNELTGFIEVVNEKKKIQILYSQPHPDIAAFKAVLKELDSYSVSTSSFENFKWEESNHLTVLFGMPENQRELEEVERQLMKRNSNHLFFLNSKVNYELMKSPEFSVLGSDESSEMFFELDPEFSLFKISKESNQKISRFPPVSVPYGEYVFSHNYKMLGVQKAGKVSTSIPMMCFKQGAQRRTAIVVGEGIWNWRMHELMQSPDAEPSAFDELFGKTVKYLTVDFDADKIQLVSKNIFELGEKIIIAAKVKNSIKEDVSELDVYASLRGQGVTLSLLMNPLDGGYVLSVSELPAGEYDLILSASLDGEKLRTRKKIVIKAFYIEQMVLQADHKLLRDIAQESQGAFYNLNEAKELIDFLNQKDYVIESYFEFFTKSLMKFKWLLYMLVVMLGLEWFIRKWYGTI
jgi:hypothetical protein